MDEEIIFADAFEAFAAYITTDELTQIIEEEIYKALLEGITGATREEALEMAREQAGLLVQEIANGTREGLAQVITEGMKDQIGVDGVAKNLRDMIGLNAQRVEAVNKYKDELIAQGLDPDDIDILVSKFASAQIKERAELVATTEIRRAMEAGEKMVMQDRGARYKASISVGDDVVSDICQQNEADGPIPIDDIFSSGDDLPPYHPNCRCRVTYITSDDQLARSTDRAKERAEKTAKAKGDDTDTEDE